MTGGGAKKLSRICRAGTYKKITIVVRLPFSQIMTSPLLSLENVIETVVSLPPP